MAEKHDYPITFETFADPKHGLLRLQREDPSCWNGVVSVIKYRVTVERVEEQTEVIAERVRKLWRELPYNHHHTLPLRTAAKKYGIDLDNAERAVDAPRPRGSDAAR